MGRPPPRCDQDGVKKGPWTPEEDIVLVSYIQEHGPGNWKAVPTNTGLIRCSKSCRLRWTNYLRPGIKRGNFTDQEEKLICHLQALLGNRWAAISSYLPERTDNDIKNYWNTHLKKKLRKLGTGNDRQTSSRLPSYRSVSKGQWSLQTDIHMAKRALSEALSMEKSDDLLDSMASSVEGNFNIRPSTYASSTENISRLLEGWFRDSPKPGVASASSASGGSMSPEPLESLFGINESPAETRTPLSLLESWLFDESVGHGQESLPDMAPGDDACDQFMF